MADLTGALDCLLQTADKPAEMLLSICKITRDYLQATAVIIHKNGRILADCVQSGERMLLPVQYAQNAAYLDAALLGRINAIHGPKRDMNILINDTSEHDPSMGGLCSFILPIRNMAQHLGSLILYKRSEHKGKAFTSVDEQNARTCLLVLSLIMRRMNDDNDAEGIQMHSAVRSALGALSFSELDAVLHVIRELETSQYGTEQKGPGARTNDEPSGIVIAGHVAQRHDITRSSIVNGLRKLQSAGLIETRSLGTKGTYIKVMNRYLIPELGKMG